MLPTVTMCTQLRTLFCVQVATRLHERTNARMIVDSTMTLAVRYNYGTCTVCYI